MRYPAAKMRQFVAKLHAAGQSWVPIVDPAVSVDATFKAYSDGTRDKIWMRDHKGKTYVGQVRFGFRVWVSGCLHRTCGRPGWVILLLKSWVPIVGPGSA